MTTALPGDRRPRWRRVLLRAAVPVALALGYSCATVGSVSVLAGGISPSGGPSWPPQPDVARIRYLGSLAVPDDAGAGRSRFRRVLDALVGRAGRRVLQPYGVAVDSSGVVYVTDTRARGVHVFDARRRRYEFIERFGRTAFRSPMGVAVDRAGNLYITDSELGVVVSLDPARRLRWTSRAALRRPSGIAVHPGADLVYVVETQGHRVVVFDREGGEAFAFGRRGEAAGELNYPTNVAVSEDGEVYVTDSMNFRVQAFDTHGVALAHFGQPGDGVGDMTRPKGIGLDSEGHVYVVEGLFDVVNVYGRGGGVLLSFGGPGHRVGEFWLAAGLAVDRGDRVYVADSFNSRVQVFQYLRAAP